MVQMVHSSCTDTAVNIPGLRIQYDNRHLTSWLLQGKTKKHFVGIQKILSLHIVVYQYNAVAEQKHCSAEIKITVRKVLSDYNLTTKMDMPGRQTF